MRESKKLGQLSATAICGNDISSSVLYVSGLSIALAGQYAWITLLMVSFVLYLFRKIYSEVVGALPFNGGTYNVLLNTTSKSTASLAATLTILSYMATSVISANEAIHYLHHILPALPIILATIVLLSFFATLVILGISESAKVAVTIFIFHMVSLLILSGFIGVYLFQNGIGLFIDNWFLPLSQNNSIANAIFLGFAASMLGVSGFESSANFVEQQRRGVFPKTLRNMWLIVSVFNPLMAVFALALFTVPVIQSNELQSTLLIAMGQHVGGETIAYLIAIDAFLVLSGAVLTSFVGVTGLLERMTLDRIIPKFFIKKNSRGSAYRIVLVFLLLSISVLLFTQGEVTLLAGVYTLSFLSVMALFALGNLLLKVRRAQLPRFERATWISVLIAILAIIIALIGNISMPAKQGHNSNVSLFLYYFIPAMCMVIIMLHRTFLLKLLLKSIHVMFNPLPKFGRRLGVKIHKLINKINTQTFVFFSKEGDVETLNRVMQYIAKNEHTKNLKIVMVVNGADELPSDTSQKFDFLDKAYPKIHIDLETIEGTFSPQLVKDLVKKWSIPSNFMFMGSPGADFPYQLEKFGDVRLII